MTDIRRTGDVPFDELMQAVEDKAMSVPRTHFLEAANDLFDRKAQQLGKELTGRDIEKNEEVLIIRNTFDHANSNLERSKKVDSAVISNGVKSFFQIMAIITALALSTWANFKP